jgi:hypothetical protein
MKPSASAISDAVSAANASTMRPLFMLVDGGFRGSQQRWERSDGPQHDYRQHQIFDEFRAHIRCPLACFGLCRAGVDCGVSFRGGDGQLVFRRYGQVFGDVAARLVDGEPAV